MKHLVAALIAAAAATSAAAAATRIEPLRPLAGNPAETCTADRVWCVTKTETSASIRHRNDGVLATLPVESNEDERIEAALWPSIIRVSAPGRLEVVLVGIARTQREAYSGGGGFVKSLTLFELRPGANVKPRAALDVALESSFLIRACFSRSDKRRRRGACHDEYRYRATLTASPGGLVYKARADSYPGPRNRFDDDAAQEGALRKADLYRAVDRRCTFTRSLALNAATGGLEWNKPPPDCAEYLDLQ